MLGPSSNLAKNILIFSLLITQNYVILYINLKQKKTKNKKKKNPTLYISLQLPQCLTPSPSFFSFPLFEFQILSFKKANPTQHMALLDVIEFACNFAFMVRVQGPISLNIPKI